MAGVDNIALDRPSTPVDRGEAVGMTSDKPDKPLRAGSAPKRAAILTAARELFLADGFDRTSVDAVSARAEVSKRTVYDYFGDKRALLGAVIEGSAQSLLDSVKAEIKEHLTEFDDLEEALTAFSTRIATSTIGSSDYVAMRRLISMEAVHLPERLEHWMDDEPEEAVAERMAEFGRRGLLEVPDPRLAADHFIALTFSPIFNAQGKAPKTDGAQEQRLLVEGVRAFLRAYAPPS
jgi:TetR/AcrR family transcriptional repressor of mexJK operon